MTGIEPAPAHWRYAESRSEVLRAAITLHPPTCWQRYEKLSTKQRNLFLFLSRRSIFGEAKVTKKREQNIWVPFKRERLKQRITLHYSRPLSRGSKYAEMKYPFPNSVRLPVAFQRSQSYEKTSTEQKEFILFLCRVHCKFANSFAKLRKVEHKTKKLVSFFVETEEFPWAKNEKLRRSIPFTPSTPLYALYTLTHHSPLRPLGAPTTAMW